MPTVAQPRPSTQFGRFGGQLLGRAAAGRHPPQVAQLRVADKHQPFAIRGIARGVVEIILVDRVVQCPPLAGGQIEHADAAMGITTDHAAEDQATAIGRPVETKQLGAVAARGLAHGTAGGAGDQYLAAVIGTKAGEGDFAAIRRPVREAVAGTCRRRKQLA
ncbi:hypothetical protein D3C72_1368940 [compost metagenome]